MGAKTSHAPNAWLGYQTSDSGIAYTSIYSLVEDVVKMASEAFGLYFYPPKAGFPVSLTSHLPPPPQGLGEPVEPHIFSKDVKSPC